MRGAEVDVLVARQTFGEKSVSFCLLRTLWKGPNHKPPEVLVDRSVVIASLDRIGAILTPSEPVDGLRLPFWRPVVARITASFFRRTAAHFLPRSAQY